MPQLNFIQTYPALPRLQRVLNNSSVSFVPIQIWDSISWVSINWAIRFNGSEQISARIGLYSLNGSTLSLANSASATASFSGVSGYYVTFTATSATQNITPGTWWIGILASTASGLANAIYGNSVINPVNAFPGSFIGGKMTVSTNALPASYATSNLDITDGTEMFVPYMILTA